MNDLDFDFGDVAACQRLIQRYAHAHGRTYLDVFGSTEDTLKLFAMLIMTACAHSRMEASMARCDFSGPNGTPKYVLPEIAVVVGELQNVQRWCAFGLTRERQQTKPAREPGRRRSSD